VPAGQTVAPLGGSALRQPVGELGRPAVVVLANPNGCLGRDIEPAYGKAGIGGT